MIMIIFHKGELEFRRDSLILSAAFLAISLTCTSVVLKKLDAAVAEQREQRLIQDSMLKKMANSEKLNVELSNRLNLLEANERALSKLQKDNQDTVVEIKNLIKNNPMKER